MATSQEDQLTELIKALREFADEAAPNERPLHFDSCQGRYYDYVCDKPRCIKARAALTKAGLLPPD